MQNSIPISFQRGNDLVKGEFSPVYGGGNHMWHLTVNSYYYGRLRLTEGQQWVFDSTPRTDDLQSMADFFGAYVTAWIE